METDWDAWHHAYEDPRSPMSERLRVVQRHVDDWLDETAPNPVTALSSCAGDGRDLLGVLGRRSDAQRVTATLLEADPRNAARATGETRRLGLSSVHVRCTDAGVTDAYAGAVPADLVLLCGIFGNVTDEDVRRTVAATPQFCSRNAMVVWTRHRRDPDLTPSIRSWFASGDFEEEAFVAPDRALFSVGAHRFRGSPHPLGPGRRLFTFIR